MARGKKTGGRVKGTPNTTTAALKDAILAAATEAGGGNLQAYLTARAMDQNKGPFMGLLGKIIPLQHEGGDPNKPIAHKLKIEFVRPGD